MWWHIRIILLFSRTHFCQDLVIFTDSRYHQFIALTVYVRCSALTFLKHQGFLLFPITLRGTFSDPSKLQLTIKFNLSLDFFRPNAVLNVNILFGRHLKMICFLSIKRVLGFILFRNCRQCRFKPSCYFW